MSDTFSIEFDLAPIEAIEPWGAPEDPSLHWFGLSLGWNVLRVGSVELLRYTDAALDRIGLLPECWYRGPYVDYQLARLHEDMLALLPAAVTPVSRDVASLLRARSLLATSSDLSNRMHEISDAEIDGFMDEVEPAIEYVQSTGLDMMHLVQGQRIAFWCDADEVIVEWDSRDSEPSKPTWTAGSGSLSVRRSDFVDAVTRFHNSLMFQMEQRVSTLELNGGIPGVRLDLRALRSDHAGRGAGLRVALKQVPVERDWDAVRNVFSNLRR